MIRPLYLNQDTERERTRIHIGAFEFEFRKSKVDYPGSVYEVAFFMSGRYVDTFFGPTIAECMNKTREALATIASDSVKAMLELETVIEIPPMRSSEKVEE